MSASIAAPVVDEFEELETRPMNDRDHRATFGWAWDDPDEVEEQ